MAAQNVWEAKLAKLKRELRRELRLEPRRRARTSTRHQPRWLTRDNAVAAAIALAKGMLIVALPFLVYVRGSVELYSSGVGAWSSVLGGILLTVGAVIGLAFWVSRRYGGRDRVRAAVRWIAVPAVILWCGFGLFHLSSDNAKTDDVRGYFSQVHPVLRVALATAILADPDMIVTDLARVPSDYTRMGLPINERTKHYRQSSGWVHAVDLRTRERNEVRNRMLQFFFWTMGFQTRRHVGTADHLHVQLATRE